MWWQRRPEPTMLEDFKAAVAAKAEDRTSWFEEWWAAREAALAKVEKPEAEFLVWQGQRDGWWYVGRWAVETSPSHMPPSRLTLVAEPKKPSMTVTAYGRHVPFEPRFKTEAEARKWLRDYLKPPQAKTIGFDAEGNEVTMRQRP